MRASRPSRHDLPPAFRAGDLRALAAIAALANALFLAALILWIGTCLMNRIVLAAALAMAAVTSLSACAGFAPVGTISKNAPAEVQKVQAEANAAFTNAVATRLEHCDITGTISGKLVAAPDAGFENTLSLTCPHKPWEGGSVTPLSQFTPAVSAEPR